MADLQVLERERENLEINLIRSALHKYANIVDPDETACKVRSYTVCHPVFFISDWHHYLQQWTCPDSKQEVATSEN